MPELPPGAPLAPITPIGEVAKWEFRISCSGCRRRVMVSVASVIERLGPRVPIYRIVDRFRCDGWTPSGRCGAVPRSVVLAKVWRRGKSTRIEREIEVWPGSSRYGR
jgi:hypothetical protein